MIGLSPSQARIVFILCTCFFLSGKNCAQHTHNFFYGKVTEEGTTRGLPGVNLFLEGSRTGTVTDRNGAFSFFTDSIPATLTVSHVGFETKTILLDETSFRLSLYLRRIAANLREVEIRANLLEPVFRDDQHSVLDFDVDSSRVWLLIFRDRLSRAEMICMNLEGDTLASSGPITVKPKGLFRDCIGTLHLVSRDSGFQIFLSGTRIELIHPVKLKKFDDVLKNCVASTEEVLFFKKVTNHGMSVEFFGINRKTLMQKSIRTVGDEEKLKMQRRNAADAYFLMNSRPPESREDFVNWNYVHKILYRPVKAVLSQVGNYTCVFNTPACQVEFYDKEGNFSYKLPLQTGKIDDGRWTQDILIDKITARVYTCYLRNGQCAVYEIDLNNGNLIHRVDLEHPFPEKVRIYNGWVYYLYDLSAEADNKILYRQKM